MQRFLNIANWDADRLRDLNRDYVVENLADPEGILIADPTGFAKKGKKSAGVQRQYSGTLGRIDNCQIGTFLAYVNGAGDRVLIDRELYIPEKSWFGDPQRCVEAGIPAELTFATRPRQVVAMIRRTLPQRRAAETFDLRFWNQPFTVTVGFYADGTPGEVFIEGCKTGNDIESIALSRGMRRS